MTAGALNIAYFPVVGHSTGFNEILSSLLEGQDAPPPIIHNPRKINPRTFKQINEVRATLKCEGGSIESHFVEQYIHDGRSRVPFKRKRFGGQWEHGQRLPSFLSVKGVGGGVVGSVGNRLVMHEASPDPWSGSVKTIADIGPWTSCLSVKAFAASYMGAKTAKWARLAGNNFAAIETQIILYVCCDENKADARYFASYYPNHVAYFLREDGTYSAMRVKEASDLARFRKGDSGFAEWFWEVIPTRLS